MWDVIRHYRQQWKAERKQRSMWSNQERVVKLTYEPFEGLFERDGFDAIEKYSKLPYELGEGNVAESNNSGDCHSLTRNYIKSGTSETPPPTFSISQVGARINLLKQIEDTRAEEVDLNSKLEMCLMKRRVLENKFLEACLGGESG